MSPVWLSDPLILYRPQGATNVLILFVIFAISMGVWSARLALSEKHYHDTRRVIDSWQRRGYVSESAPNQLQKSVETAQRALDYHAGSARAWQALAELHAWQAYESRFDQHTAAQAHEKALSAIARALRAQPTNASLWAALGRYALYSRGHNSITGPAVRKAVRLGLWQLEVQRQLGVFGIRYWPYLSPSSRRHIRRIIQVAMQSDTTHQARPIDHWLIDTAFEHQWLGELLPLAHTDNQRRRIRTLRAR